jgi:glycosyltransferase involved in cell wall biosynthesis
MENLKEDLIKKINEKIKDNKIKMKPRFYFVLQGFLLMSFILIIFLGALYIGNFILLIFHEHVEAIDFLHIDSFDFHKFLDFLRIIPGLLILLLLVFIFSLYKLIKGHSFVYRKNILYIILILFLILIITVMNIHLFLDRNFDRIKFGEKGELPVVFYLHKYYRGVKLPPPPILLRNFPNQVKVLENRAVLDSK